MKLMLDKQIWAIFLFEFKMVIKHQRQLTFGPETANECTVQWWFRKFHKGDESLEDEEHSGRPLEVDNNQLRAVIEADPLTPTRKVSHLKQTGKVRKFAK